MVSLQSPQGSNTLTSFSWMITFRLRCQFKDHKSIIKAGSGNLLKAEHYPY